MNFKSGGDREQAASSLKVDSSLAGNRLSLLPPLSRNSPKSTAFLAQLGIFPDSPRPTGLKAATSNRLPLKKRPLGSQTIQEVLKLIEWVETNLEFVSAEQFVYSNLLQLREHRQTIIEGSIYFALDQRGRVLKTLNPCVAS